MIASIKEWLKAKWRPAFDQDQLKVAYVTAFNSPAGSLVLQHLIDTVYCQVYQGIDPIACITHNARRSVIHEILLNIDAAQHPAKYLMRTITEMEPMA